MRSLRSAIAVAAIAGMSLGVGVLHAPFTYAIQELGLLLVLYLGLAALLHGGCRWLAGRHGFLGLAGSLTVGGALVVQARIDAERLVSLPLAAGAAVAIGVVHYVLFVRERRRDEEERPGPWLALTGLVVFGGLLGWTWRDDATRWHLLHHHRTVGQTMHAVVGPGIGDEREDLWDGQPELVSAARKANAVVPDRPRGGDGAPHVVVVLVDTLRADMLAAWGGDPDLMPRTNELATRSVVLADVLANASWTRASCASLFTGLLPEEHGAVDFHDRLSDGWWTLPELLGKAGYETAAFVSNWVQVGKTTGFAQGFDEFREVQALEEFEALMETGADNLRGEYARAEAVNASVFDWLEKREGTGPAFLYVHYLDPHSPYKAGQEPGVTGGPRAQKFGAYRQEVRYLDVHLGELYERLRAELEGPLVLVFTSDHGEEFWEHGQWGHGHTLYREQLWVPTFVYQSESAVGEVAAEPLEGRDLFGLILSLADPAGVDVTAWARERARGDRYASQYIRRAIEGRPDHEHTALRLLDDGSSTLIWSGYGPSWQLFDRESDPDELRNRIGEAEVDLEAMRRRLEEMPRFWAERPRVERTERDLGFLRALGYVGGTSPDE